MLKCSERTAQRIDGPDSLQSRLIIALCENRKQTTERDTTMDYCKGKITKLLVEYFENDFGRITHALEVLKYAEKAAESTEDVDCEILIASALLHDVGIKPSEEKFGYNDGKTQEELGPPVAEELLRSTDFPHDKITKVCEIIGNHHSRSRYNYVELRILKEADRIVNKIEGD
jgi:putative nucleotidyltransferase with HDIG domain